MRTYLLPHNFKKIGWLLLIPSLIIGILMFIFNWDVDWLNFQVPALLSTKELLGKPEFFKLVSNNLLDEIIGLSIVIGGMMIAFSREKVEDEFISKIRLDSLVWATYLNYAILLMAILFVFDICFFYVMIFNMFTVLFFFIARFNWMKFRVNKTLSDEK